MKIVSIFKVKIISILEVKIVILLNGVNIKRKNRDKLGKSLSLKY